MWIEDILGQRIALVFYIYINTVQHPTFCDLEEKLNMRWNFTCLR